MSSFKNTCITLILTGNGSAPSWMINPSIKCVRMWALTKAWAGLLSPLCWLLLVFPFPEVMTGAQATPSPVNTLNGHWPDAPAV